MSDAKDGRRAVIWVRDVRTPEFRAEARRQAAGVASSPFAAHDQAFIDAVSSQDEG
jgi:hypothetical protein